MWPSSSTTVALFGLLALTGWTAAYDPNDPAGVRFRKCCEETGVTCTEMCVHPPPADLTLSERICMLFHFSSFVHCATGGKDNRKCCEAADVTSEGENPQCLDLCYDSHPYPLPKYADCDSVRLKIDTCNHDANNEPLDEPDSQLAGQLAGPLVGHPKKLEAAA